MIHMAYKGSITAYRNGPPQARRNHRDTYIEDEPQLGVRQMPSKVKSATSITTMTTAALPPSGFRSQHTTPASDQTSDASSMWSKRSSRFDDEDLYDVTDDESVEIKIMCSDSVKRTVAKDRGKVKYPSLIIPSPSCWPMPPSAQKTSAGSIGLSPASKIALSPVQLAMLRVPKPPSCSSAPSLDGSLTSEELAASSCPSTPDMELANTSDGRWSSLRLDPEACATLHHIHPDSDVGSDSEDQVIDVSPEAMREMMEIVNDPPYRRQIVPGGQRIRQGPSPVPSEPISALSVPSPGGFFASLRGHARSTWCVDGSSLPSTGVAENFYGVPWRYQSRSRSRSPRVNIQTEVNQPQPAPVIEVSPIDCSPVEKTDVAEISEAPFEYDTHYQDDLKRTALANFDRTKLWLTAQDSYLSALIQETPKTPIQQLTSCFSPDTPDTPHSFGKSSIDPSPKKPVRFMESIPEGLEMSIEPTTAHLEPIFFQGFQYMASRVRRRDAFLHRQSRAEAAHVESMSLPQKRVGQLQGTFEVKEIERPAPARPISSCLPAASDDERKELIANAERERQALEQIMPGAWELQAARSVFGSQLVTSPAVALLRCPTKVLDFGGEVACDWAWHVALRYPKATIFTIPTMIENAKACVKGPNNHRVVTASHLCNLPFPDNYFDLISARTLYAILKSSHATDITQDEYDTIVREFYRVLKPGGYLEYNFIDAELLHPGTLGHALSVEFSFNLRTLGYDAQASKSFLPRLRRAGFNDIKRAWMVLPCADVTPRWVDNGKFTPLTPPPTVTPNARAINNNTASYFPVEKCVSPNGERQVYEPPLTGSTADVRAMTGLVGSRAWEKWILKLTREMGGDEERTLEKIGKALEESGKGKAGWRCLMGWARKDVA